MSDRKSAKALQRPKPRREVPTILEFCTDPQLLALSLSPAQETLLRAIYGLPLDAEQLALWRRCTGREGYRPGHVFSEVTVICGAGSGKDSRIAVPILCYEVVFGGHERRLGRGEQGVFALVAQDERATDVAFGYVREYLTESGLLAGRVADVLANKILLPGRLRIQCFPCTKAALRAWSIPVGIMDEPAFYRLEGAADSDVEIQASIRRGMMRPGFVPKLVKISTPYLRDGVLWADYQRAWGQADPDLLVWRAPTALMNPGITPAQLDRQRRLDPERFLREFEAEFVEGLESFLQGAWVEAAVVAGRSELPPVERVRYAAGVDVMGGGTGAGADAFALSLTHVEGAGAEQRLVQDVLRSWPKARGVQPGYLEGIVSACGEILDRYGVPAVAGDSYGKGWVAEAFARAGIDYVECPRKADVYLTMEPYFAQGRIDLLDDAALQRELRLLERQRRPGGLTRVDHPRGRHDDRANALAVSVWAALEGARQAAGRSPEEEARMAAEERAFERAMGLRPVHPDVIYDEDLGMFMDDPNYPDPHRPPDADMIDTGRWG